MSTRTGSRGGILGVVFLAGAVFVAAGAVRWFDAVPESRRDGKPVRIVATWEGVHEHSILVTAGGIRQALTTRRQSPYTMKFLVGLGETVTVSVTPLSGPGKRGCVIERPPGVPLWGAGQDTRKGTEMAFCTAVIGV